MKLKKVIMAIIGTIIGCTIAAANVFALDTVDSRNISEDFTLISFSENETSALSADSIVYLGNVNWSDSKKVTWKEGNTTAYHTLTSRISDLYVYNTYVVASTYTNHNGTYNNVWVLEVAPDTLFMSSDVYSSPSSGYNSDYTDPYYGLTTPRRLTTTELSDENVVAYIIYNPSSDEVIDFYSVFNPLIMSGWSEPEFTF